MAASIEAVKTIVHTGKTDNCAHIVCTEASAFRFSNILKKSGAHTFQTMIKSKVSSSIRVDLGDSSQSLPTTTTWKKVVSQGIADISLSTNVEIVFSAGEYWLYNTKIEFGNLTAWSISPYDFADTVNNLETKIVANTTSISQVVIDLDNTKKEVELKATQSDINTSINGIKPDIEKATLGVNKWLVQIYDKSSLPEASRELTTIEALIGTGSLPSKSINVADVGLTTAFPYGNNQIGYALTFVNFSVATTLNTSWMLIDDGSLLLNGKTVNAASGNVSLSFKQGWNILEVIWNIESTSAAGGFRFGTNISEHANCQLMNCYYQTITSRDTLLGDKYAGIKIDVDSITTRVSDVVSTLETKADGDVVQTLSEKVNEAIDTVESFKRTVSESYITNDYKTYVESSFEQLTNSISTRVTEDQLNSAIQQNANAWRLDFSENGAISGSTTINKEGITVGGDSTSGYTTKITSQEFSGSFDGNKVFWFNREETVTERLRTLKGIDLQTIKIIPTVQNGYGGIDFLGSYAII